MLHPYITLLHAAPAAHFSLPCLPRVDLFARVHLYIFTSIKYLIMPTPLMKDGEVPA
jgi:hypothetical protein